MLADIFVDELNGERVFRKRLDQCLASIPALPPYFMLADNWGRASQGRVVPLNSGPALLLVSLSGLGA